MAAQRAKKLSRLEISAAWAQIIESFAIVVGLVLGAWWFLEQRENYPRADVSQSISTLVVQPGVIAIEANVSVKNAGKKQLKLTSAVVKLQEVTGEPFQYGELSKKVGETYWRAKRPFETSQNSNQFDAGELRWPILKSYSGKIKNHIEPGETDNLIFTFLVPCKKLVREKLRTLSTVRVATDILKPQTEDGQEFAWKARGVSDVTKECSK